MIIGTGIDIIEVERVEKAMKDRPERIFTVAEVEYFNKFTSPGQHIAGTWAAKEAVAKALGTGFSGVSYKEIEITRINGAPVVQLSGKAKARFDLLGGKTLLISISHIEKYAVANAVLEG